MRWTPNAANIDGRVGVTSVSAPAQDSGGGHINNLTLSRGAIRLSSRQPAIRVGSAPGSLVEYAKYHGY